MKTIIPYVLFSTLLLLFFPSFIHSQVPTGKLSIWLKANEGAESNNDSVYKWKDFSSNHKDAVPTTPGKPHYIKDAVNGLPAIRFDGENTGLETLPLSTFENKKGTLFVVFKTNGRSFRSSVGVGNVVSTYHGNGFSWQFCAGPKGFSFYDGVGGEGLNLNKSASSDWCFISLCRASDTLCDFYMNGRFQNNFHINNNQPAINTLKIGYNGMKHFDPDDITEVFNGDIAELIIYNRALSKEDLKQVHQYLSDKYKIELLPAPYYYQWWFYLFISVFMLLLISLIVKTIQNRRIKKQLLKLQLEQEIAQERIRISQDIHDELGSGLSKIKLLSELINSGSATEKQMLMNLHSIAETSGSLVENMRDLVWAMNPENATLDSLIARIREYSYDYMEEFPIELNIASPDTIPSIKISNEANRNILMIVKEGFQNVVKHASSTEVFLTITIDSALKIQIKDNGIGYDFVNVNNGNGLKNMKIRCEAIHAKLTFHSQINLGSVIDLEIPLDKMTKQ